MTAPEPAWKQLHRDWWADQRKPQPGDLTIAWLALWEVVPWDGWSVTQPAYDPGSRQWHCSAVRLKRSARKAARNVVAAAGPSDAAVIVELARCLVEVGKGRVPK